jgi:hypothetical protein
VSQASAAAAVAAMVELRGGFTATDSRLGRLPELDERSRRFSVADVLDTSKSLRSKSWPLSIMLDQGADIPVWSDDSACTGGSRIYDLSAGPVRVKKPDGTDLDMLFAHAAYQLGKKNDEWPGEGYPGSSVLGVLKALKIMGFVGEYRWGFSLNDILLALSWHGPVVFGTDWYNSQFDAKENGLIVPDFQSGFAGGHAYTANFIKVSKQAKRKFLGPNEEIKDEPLIGGPNSWGASWGQRGFWCMWSSDMWKLMRADKNGGRYPGEASVVTKALRWSK